MRKLASSLLIAAALALRPAAAPAAGVSPNIQSLVGIGDTTTPSQQAHVDANGNLQVVQTPQSSSTYGIAPCVAGSASSNCILKTTAGNLYGLYVTATSAGYLMVFNTTTVPSNGSTTAGTASSDMQDCIQVPANSTVSLNNGDQPEVFSAGMVAVFSSGANCGTLTASSAAFIRASYK